MLAGSFIHEKFVVLNQRFFDVAVLLKGEQSVIHQADHVERICVIVRVCGVKIVDVVGQVHGDVRAEICFFLIFACTACKAKEKHNSGQKKCNDPF